MYLVHDVRSDLAKGLFAGKYRLGNAKCEICKNKQLIFPIDSSKILQLAFAMVENRESFRV